MDERLDIILRTVDEATAELRAVRGEVEKLSGETDKASKSAVNWGNVMRSVAQGSAIVFGGLTATVFAGAKASMALEEANVKLEHTLRTAVDATDEQIESIRELAKAQAELGVVNELTTLSGAAQLATFDLLPETIEKIIGPMNDLLVAERGVNATSADAIGLANGLGKAMQGQFDILRKSGFQFGEVEEAIFNYGEEAEKAQLLTEIINSTYEDLNKTMRETAAGAFKVMQDEMSNTAMAIFKSLEPSLIVVIEKLTAILVKTSEWIAQNPELVKEIAITTGVLTGLALAIAAIMSPITLVITAIAALTAAIVYLRNKQPEVWNGIVTIVELAAKAIVGNLNFVIGVINGIIRGMNFLAGTSVREIPKIIVNFDRLRVATDQVNMSMETQLMQMEDATVLAKLQGKATEEVAEATTDWTARAAELIAMHEKEKDATKAAAAAQKEYTRTIESAQSSLRRSFLETSRDIADLSRSITDLEVQNAMRGLDERQRLAAEWVREEERIAKMREDIAERQRAAEKEKSYERREEMRREISILYNQMTEAERIMRQHGTVAAVLGTEIAGARAEAAMSPLQRAISGFNVGVTARESEFAQERGMLESKRAEAEGFQQFVTNISIDGAGKAAADIAQEVINIIDRRAEMSRYGVTV